MSRTQMVICLIALILGTFHLTAVFLTTRK